MQVATTACGGGGEVCVGDGGVEEVGRRNMPRGLKGLAWPLYSAAALSCRSRGGYTAASRWPHGAWSGGVRRFVAECGVGIPPHPV